MQIEIEADLIYNAHLLKCLILKLNFSEQHQQQ